MVRYRILSLIVLLIFTFSCSSTKDVGTIFSKISLESSVEKSISPYSSFKKWIVVDVAVNGVPAKFMLDTGAPTVLSKSFANRLGVDVLSEQDVGSVKGDIQRLEVAMVETFNFSNATFNKVGCFISDFTGSSSIECLAKEVDGILGRNVMELLNWRIDPNSKQISICSDCEYQSSSRAYPFSVSHKGMIVDIELEGRSEKWLFDSGSGTGLMIKKGTELSEYDKKTSSLGKSLSTAFEEHVDTVYHYYYDSLSLGEQEIVNGEISQLDIQENIIGNGFLSHYVTTIDFANNELFLDQIQSFTAEYNHYGFEIGLNEDSNYEVALIYSKHKKRGLGLDVGDVITRINSVELPTNVGADFYCANYHVSHFIERDATDITVEVVKENGAKKTIRSKLGSFY